MCVDHNGFCSLDVIKRDFNKYGALPFIVFYTDKQTDRQTDVCCDGQENVQCSRRVFFSLILKHTLS